MVIVIYKVVFTQKYRFNWLKPATKKL